MSVCCVCINVHINVPQRVPWCAAGVSPRDHQSLLTVINKTSVWLCWS